MKKIILTITLLFCAGYSVAIAEQLDSSLPIDGSKSIMLGQKIKVDTNATQPFGYNLFSNLSEIKKSNSLNPNYKINNGDVVSVKIWGATNYEAAQPVDKQGNIFIPDVGPVRVKDVAQSELNDVVRDKVHKTFNNNVEIYTNLESSLPVSIFISGAVENPGRYEGTTNDSVIDFIKKAGGIDLERGSFRDIRIKRYNKTEEIFDLYEFLQKGDLPLTALEDGDTILVTEKGMQVTAEGEVLNKYKFEFIEDSVKGLEFKKFVSPKPEATHAVIEGIREGKPFKKYAKIKEFDDFKLLNGDKVNFEAGEHGDKIKVIISGLHNGSKTLVLPLDAKLSEVLNNTPVDKNVSNIDAVYIKRKSVAAKQKQAIQDSVKRLQETLVLARASGSAEKSPIGEGEIRLLQTFANRAEMVEPDGKVVVKNKDGYSSNLMLEDGDEIVIPQKTNLVMVNGEVIMPKAILWEDGMSVSSYIEKSGGFTDNANTSNIIVIRANGETVLGSGTSLKAGDEIMVMPEVKVNNLELASKVAEILYRVAIAVAIPFRL